MKRFLKLIINQNIWNHLRYLKFRIFKLGKFAPYNLDTKLNKYLNYDYGYFIELGANDGFTESNTLYLEIKKMWRGILIEPSPSQFLDCCLYRSKPGNHLYCNACVPFYFQNKYVDIEYANLMSVSKNIENHLSDISNHLISGRQHIMKTARSISFGSIAKTLTDIMDDCNAPKTIDFLSLDVEGSELSVLKGVDFNKYKFKYILVECRKLNLIEKFLTQYGYKKIEKLTHHDYLFKYNL